MAHVVEVAQCEPVEEAQDDALVYSSDDEDSNMQGNARPVGVHMYVASLKQLLMIMKQG